MIASSSITRSIAFSISKTGRVESYRGNYSDYLVEREERREQRRRAYRDQQEMIARTEDFIRRNLAGQKTKQAKSRRNFLERMERVKNVGDLETANFKLNRRRARATRFSFSINWR